MTTNPPPLAANPRRGCETVVSAKAAATAGPAAVEMPQVALSSAKALLAFLGNRFVNSPPAKGPAQPATNAAK